MAAFAYCGGAYYGNRVLAGLLGRQPLAIFTLYY